MTPDERVQRIIEDECISTDADVDALRSLARDHAALLDWAARAADELKRHAWRPDATTERINTLLAEWAEMQERPS